MEKTCYYCGTKYPAEEERCPLCGQTETEPEAVDEVPVDLRTEEEPKAAEPPKEKKKKSGAASTIACIVLGALVLAGVIFILSALGILPFGKTGGGENVALPEGEEVACTSLAVTPETIEFTEEGQMQLFTITRKPAGCTEELTCEVQNPAVASVNEKCELTALTEGETDVIITCGDQTAILTVTCKFTPDEPEVPQEPAETTETAEAAEPAETAEPTEPASAELKISNEDFTLFSAGETTTLTVEGAGGASVAWSSNDTSVVTVDGGKVTAVGPGMATITATVGDKSVKAIARCKFEAASAPVQTVVGDLAISHEDVTLRENGETFTLSVTSGGNRVSGISWSTSNASVAQVSDSGKVTAVGSGMATITGTYGGTKLSCIVRCSF